MHAPHDLAIVGAGPAGIFAAAAARERGLRPIVLERGSEPGGLWARVPPDMLCLSPRRRDRMPDGGTPQGPGDRATAGEVLAALRRAWQADPPEARFGFEVAGLRREEGVFHLDGAAPLQANRVVLATGEFGRPHQPALPDSFAGRQEHSSSFDASTVQPGERVAVIGSANSATDVVGRLLGRRAQVTVFARQPIGRPKGLPRGPLERLLWAASGIPTRALPPSLRCGSSLPPVDPVLFDNRRRGRIAVLGAAVALEGDAVVADDGTRAAADRVIWCTGFLRDLAWTGLELDARGVPRHDRGLSIDMPGLAFLGLRCMRTRRSEFLRGLLDDARSVVTRL